MGYKRSPLYNASGYPDLTAFEAIRNVEREERKNEERVKKLLATLFYICDLAGFRVRERIVLEDKKTGKVWR